MTKPECIIMISMREQKEVIESENLGYWEAMR